MSTTFSDLKTFAQDYVADMNDAKAVRQVERAVNNGFRRLARENDWSFYVKHEGGRINFTAQYDTGTVTVAQNGTTATLADGTWPDPCADRKLVFDDNALLEFGVKTRDSDSQVTFEDGQVWVDTAISDGSYTMYQDLYSLPSDFQKFYTGRGEAQYLRCLEPIEFARYKLANRNMSDDPPRVYTLVGDDKVQVYPYPTSAYVWNFIYHRWPTVLSSDSDAMDWPERRRDTAEYAILVELAREFPGTSKIKLSEAMALYKDSVSEAWSEDRGRHRAYYRWGLSQISQRRLHHPEKAGLITDE
jgi:hypothetical protein